ncbi:uncharacterized protein LOC120114187 [Hibiscus syriacus]|uniref:uncharacterized protein LOC120114187 n=1 Tax=Hibiscus syriacus TaxID=106335 RepID=UPI0019225102|nr:uncharacterized protein LOC120114187 [Hibiscus syriacus]XP_038991106.1 uncharacterized protein LOC120114187 [Hibiscus syriacus]
MDDTTSVSTGPYSASGMEYSDTGPYSASGMEYSSIHNQSHNTCQWHLQPEMTDGMTRSQATQGHSLEVEASQQPRPGGQRPRMSIDERKARKRQIDAKHRRRKKAIFDEMTAQNQFLQDEVQRLKEVIGRLSSGNTHLKEKTGQPSFENRHLQGKGQLPQEILQSQDSYISQPTIQVEQNVYVQSHHCLEDIRAEGAADECDGLGIDELLNLLSPENEMTRDGRFAFKVSATEHPTSSQSGLCPSEVAKSKLDKFLTELDAEVTSYADPSYFAGLEEEELVGVEKFRIPSSLVPTAEMIKDYYGDISAKSLISPRVSGIIYIMFCATIREMGSLRLDQVTESIMLQWRYVIKDALRLGFNVTFAMDHLKKIACAYFGLTWRQELQDRYAKILTLEAEIIERKEKRAMIYEKYQTSFEATEKFTGVPVSTGLFP